MSRNKIYAAIGLSIITLSWTVNHTITPMETARPFKVKVEELPKSIGDWKTIDERTPDPEVQKKLSSATIVDRQYDNAGKVAVSLTLVSASNSVDIHNPQLCFPNQGWRLDNQRKTTFQGQEMNVMHASNDQRSYNVLYWIQGGKIAGETSNPWIRRVRAIRKRLVPEDEGQSLLVRLIVPDSEAGRQAQKAFLEALWTPLQKLVEQAQKQANT